MSFITQFMSDHLCPLLTTSTAYGLANRTTHTTHTSLTGQPIINWVKMPYQPQFKRKEAIKKKNPNKTLLDFILIFLTLLCTGNFFHSYVLEMYVYVCLSVCTYHTFTYTLKVNLCEESQSKRLTWRHQLLEVCCLHFPAKKRTTKPKENQTGSLSMEMHLRKVFDPKENRHLG